jgi:hypothetical protein
MTYRDLRKQLNDLTEEQLDMDVTIYDGSVDELFGAYHTDLQFNLEDDILDKGHPYLIINQSVD